MIPPVLVIEIHWPDNLWILVTLAKDVVTVRIEDVDSVFLNTCGKNLEAPKRQH